MQQQRQQRAWLKPHGSAQRPRGSCYGLKFLLCISWDSPDVHHYEVVEKSQTVISDVCYSQQT